MEIIPKRAKRYQKTAIYGLYNLLGSTKLKIYFISFMLYTILDIWTNKCVSRRLVKVTHCLGLGGAIILTECFLSTLSGNYVLAQITPDATLGAEHSIITPNININGANADRIDGGAIRGANLFHSFLEFNVEDGQRVYFANPTGIDSILSRVTGNDLSDILGTLGVE
ncbi:MAG TPA: filamentous hemagglutinin N-terminal domain-containing protein, partial [Coleofasciculaceae cyanobacterium]